MNEEIRPIARALLGGESTTPDRNMSCCVCGGPAVCPGFIVESVKLWNEQEIRLATESSRRAELIRPSEMGITCDDPAKRCVAVERERRKDEYILECQTTTAYLRMLRDGTYNPESLTWLRNHGHSKDVSRLLAATGTRGT